MQIDIYNKFLFMQSQWHYIMALITLRKDEGARVDAIA